MRQQSETAVRQQSETAASESDSSVRQYAETAVGEASPGAILAGGALDARGSDGAALDDSAWLSDGAGPLLYWAGAADLLLLVGSGSSIFGKGLSKCRLQQQQSIRPRHGPREMRHALLQQIES